MIDSAWIFAVDLASSAFLLAAGTIIGVTIVLAELERAARPGPLTGTTDKHAPDVFIRNGEFAVAPEAMGAIYLGTNHTPVAPIADDPEPNLDQEEFGSNYGVLAEAHEEMLRQLDIWGEQNHPNGTGGSTAKLNRTNAKKAVEAAVAANEVTWALILKEEYTEALAEEDLEKLDTELTQVMGVCASWKQAILRQMAAELKVQANPK
jgi:hypothetical protein